MNELTDIEICKRIAEIEQPKNLEFDPKGYPMIKVKSVAEYIDYDPLTDKALCFDLMVKHELSLKKSGHSTLWFCYDLSTKNAIDYEVKGLNANPQRAICLAIIAKHK